MDEVTLAASLRLACGHESLDRLRELAGGLDANAQAVRSVGERDGVRVEYVVGIELEGRDPLETGIERRRGLHSREEGARAEMGSEAEAGVMANRIIAVADPKLITVLMKGDEIAGFALAYPDLTAAIRRCRGRLWPLGWYHLKREFKRTQWLNFNGGCILEQHRGLGGNSLLYMELFTMLMSHPQYLHADLVQIQETNTRMVQELQAANVKEYKRHRVYQRSLD